MKRIIVFALCLLCACNKKPQENLVNKIEFAPSALKMFVGDQQAIEVECYPETATNLDQLVMTAGNYSFSGEAPFDEKSRDYKKVD